ncbi:glycosyltransferase family 4 protein [Enterobacter hormaechei]|uniref:glycosyltransferase family 4 protein n=1 Tax=Enterobacter hormaechei TaxID=158836 RepID=UPI001BE06B89|nr:glycosyltransferase family 4 protein [Enterobacter hormaechei subsp. xiangfangensis]MCE1386629.1 glycosyltransferase family 4 protein [Enterobacter hormaechei]
MKKIAIILPGPRREPVGGYKVLYQYADHLASNGWQVDFIYLTNDLVCNSRFSGVKGKIKKIIFSTFFTPEWFTFRSKYITHRVTDEMDFDSFKCYEKVICSSVETFIYISEKTTLDRKKIIYFVQDYECWNVNKDRVDETLSHKDIEYITISDDLCHKIIQAGGNVVLVLYNGINKTDFYNYKLWESRPDSSFLFLYHPNKRKGCDELLEGLCKVNKDKVNTRFSCFSAYPKPKDFPSFINYFYRPKLSDLNELYNNNRFFICSSDYEGFGLTPAEAAFAGEIVLSTKNGGVEQYIQHGVNGFLIPAKDSDAFVQIIFDMIKKESSLADFSRVSSKSIVSMLNLDVNFEKLLNFLNNTTCDQEC